MHRSAPFEAFGETTGVALDARGAPPGDGRAAVLLLHGRDQDPEYMYRLVTRMPALPVTWVAPAAPDRTWYAGRMHDPLADTRAERDRAAEVVDGLAATLADQGYGPERVVLAGFSQGACVVADHLLRRPRRWGGAVLWTGAAFGPEGTDWSGPCDLAGLPVFAGTGDADPWIPLAFTEALVEALRGRGARVDARVYPGRGHEVSDDEVAAAAELIREVGAR